MNTTAQRLDELLDLLDQAQNDIRQAAILIRLIADGIPPSVEHVGWAVQWLALHGEEQSR